jgi:hypothetical protein
MTMSLSILDKLGLEIDLTFLALSYKTSSNFFCIPLIIIVDIIHPKKIWQIVLYIYAKIKTLDGK